MTFTLTIELGNDAMRSTRDIARTLREVADRISPNWRITPQAESHKIMDANGNSVGQWEVK